MTETSGDRETLQRQLADASAQLAQLEKQGQNLALDVYEAQQNLRTLRAAQFKNRDNLAETRAHIIGLSRSLGESPQ